MTVFIAFFFHFRVLCHFLSVRCSVSKFTKSSSQNFWSGMMRDACIQKRGFSFVNMCSMVEWFDFMRPIKKKHKRRNIIVLCICQRQSNKEKIKSNQSNKNQFISLEKPQQIYNLNMFCGHILLILNILIILESLFVTIVI